MSESFDLVVLGGGPAGLSGALAAGFFSRRAALVENSARIGGAGINSGTIPSKTLRETAVTLSGLRARRLVGVDLSLRRAATVADLMQHEKRVTAFERTQMEARLGYRKVERFTGIGSFVDPNTVRIRSADGSERRIHGEKILIATGSSPLRPAEFAFGDPRVHDSDEILQLTEMPRQLVVIGGGVIGSEYACIFAALNIEVHLVDGRDTLIPFLDPEIARTLARSMEAAGVKFHWNERVQACDVSNPDKVVLQLSSGATLACDGVLVCAGRQSNTGLLELAAAGLEPGKRGLIPVDERYRTSVPHIYAAGDVIGPPALAATGIEQARVAVCHAFDLAFKPGMAPLLPTGIYTIPEVSMVGETEASLQASGTPFVAGRWRYVDVARGQIIGDETGFLKLLFRRSDMRLVGAHVIGEMATEIVHIGLVAMLAGADASLFNHACFNYPTLGDLYKYATYDALAQVSGLENVKVGLPHS